jgi:hypothetical protein
MPGARALTHSLPCLWLHTHVATTPPTRTTPTLVSQLSAGQDKPEVFGTRGSRLPRPGCVWGASSQEVEGGYDKFGAERDPWDPAVLLSELLFSATATEEQKAKRDVEKAFRDSMKTVGCLHRHRTPSGLGKRLRLRSKI